MTRSRQLELIDRFLRQAYSLMEVKTADYNPEDVTLLDVYQQAFELDSTPEAVLFTVLLGKHLTAIRRYVQDRRVSSDDVRGRLLDSVNYLALLDLAISNQKELSSAIVQHIVGTTSCNCQTETRCYRCLFLEWVLRLDGTPTNR